MSFGHTIRIKREGLGLTLENLAERAKLTPNYVGSIELGKRDPSLSTVIALAKALRVAPGELLGAHGLGPNGLEAGRLLEELPSELQVTVLGLLRALPRRRR